MADHRCVVLPLRCELPFHWLARYVLSLREGMLILTESGSSAAERDEGAIALLVLVLKPAGAIFVIHLDPCIRRGHAAPTDLSPL